MIGNLWVIIKNNLRIALVKKPVYSVLLIVLPVIVLFLASKIFTHGGITLNIGIVDNSNTKSSKAIVKVLGEEYGIKIKSIDEENLSSEFGEKNINAAIIIQENFEDKLLQGDISGIKVRVLEGENIGDMINVLLGPELSNLSSLARIHEGDRVNYLKSLESYKVSDVKIERAQLSDLYGDYSNSEMFIGFLIMFIFLRAMNGAFLVSEDKNQNVYTRILTAPVKGWQYYLANIITTFILIVIQILITLVAINFFSDINIGMNYVQLFIILCVIGLVAVSIGSFCLAITDSRDLSNILSNFILMTSMFLGGCFVPVSLFPEIIDRISYFTPTRWAMEAVLDLQQGMTFSHISKYLGIMLLFAVVFFVITSYKASVRDKINNI